MPNIPGTVPYLQSGDPEAENTPTLYAPGTLGGRFTLINRQRSTPGVEDGRSKTYQLVRTDSSMSVAPFIGAVAWWSDKTAYVVTTTVTTLGRGRVAGVFQNAVTPGNYCCVQVGGPATVKFTDSVTATPDATGLHVIPSATNAKADCLAAGSAPTYPLLGYSAGSFNAASREGIVDLAVPATS